MARKQYTLKNVMEVIGDILEQRHPRASQFKIMGYSMVETVLRIFYADRDEVVVFKYKGTEPMEVTFRFTTNHEDFDRSKAKEHWVKEYNILETMEG